MEADLFARCTAFWEDAGAARALGYQANPRMAQALGIYPFFAPLDRSLGAEVLIDGQRLVMLGSNDYLGLTAHPEVREAAARAAHELGPSCTGSRLLNGTLDLHHQLEARLARLTGKEAALVFSTGYLANLGALGALLGRGDLVVADKECHASVIDAIGLARSRARVEARYFNHNDPDHLDRILSGYGPDTRKLVVTDSVFSMGGDLAPLDRLAPVCRRHGARFMVDDAHAIGVLGGGRGTAHHLGCPEAVDLVMGTFSKALASVGGFVAGPAPVIHWIQHMARPFIFTASLPPPSAAAALAALDVMAREPERIARVGQVAVQLRERLAAQGDDTGASRTPIVPVILGDQLPAMQAWSLLRKHGVYVNIALPPAVPQRSSRLRTSVVATHTDAHLDVVEAAFRAVHRKLDRPRYRRRNA